MDAYSPPTMANFKTIYKCRICGTTSYQRVMERAPDGAMQPLGAYRCCGCRNIFDSVRAWWEPQRGKDFQGSKFNAA